MKQIAILATLALLLTSCSKIKGEGEITTITSSVDGSVNTISVSNSITLKLSDKMEFGKFSITAYENIHPYIKLSSDDDRLEIGMKSENYKDLYVEVIVSSKQYNCIEASGASGITLEGETPLFSDYTIDLSGASQFRGDLDIEDMLNVDLSGASKVDITGVSNYCNATLSGSSVLYNTSFSCKKLDVDMSGASKIRMSVSESIEGGLSGASTIRYVGSPVVSVSTEGSSSVKQL